MPAAPVHTRQFQRLAGFRDRPRLTCRIDGRPADVHAGDTVLTAILSLRRHLRAADLSEERRAGFCLMGACQDCWVGLDDGTPIRACTTLVEAGMAIVTGRGDGGHAGR